MEDEKSFAKITAEELYNLLSQKTDLIIIDTLPKELFDKRHLSGAQNARPDGNNGRAANALPARRFFPYKSTLFNCSWIPPLIWQLKPKAAPTIACI